MASSTPVNIGYIPGYAVNDDSIPQILFPIVNDVILNSVSAVSNRGIYLLSNNSWHTPASLWMPPVPEYVQSAIEERAESSGGAALLMVTPPSSVEFVTIAELSSVDDMVYLFKEGELKPFSYHPGIDVYTGSFTMVFSDESIDPYGTYYFQTAMTLTPPLRANTDYTFLIEMTASDTTIFTSTSWTEPIIVSDFYFSSNPDILLDSFVYAIWSYDSRTTTTVKPGTMQLITINHIDTSLATITCRTRGSLRFNGSIDVQWRIQAIQTNDVYHD